MAKKSIPLCKTFMGEEELLAVKEVLDSGWLTNGPKVKEFEQAFAKYLGVKYAISYNSCASALQIALEATKTVTKTKKFKVIVPSFTFPASANAILKAGLIPAFCDVDEKTMNMDPDSIERVVDDNTFAVMPVHFSGQPCDMDAISDIATRYNLLIVEDSAEAIGATFNGKLVGTFGYGCFSFYPTKNMTTGEGGMLTTDDGKIIEIATALRGHGIYKGAYDRQQSSSKWKRIPIISGYNFRMPDVLAAIGLVQLSKLEKMNQFRITKSSELSRQLSDLPLDVPYVDPRATHVYQMYVIRLHNSIDRSRFLEYLNNRNIDASVHFDPPLHKQEIYRSYGTINLLTSEKLANKVVTLPMFPSMSDTDLEYLVESVRLGIDVAKI